MVSSPAALAGHVTLALPLTRPHDAGVPVHPGTVPGRGDVEWPSRHTGAMTKLWRVAVLLPALGLVAVGSGFAGWSSVMIGAVVGVTGAVALLVLRRHPTHRIGWLLAVQSCLVAAMAPGGGGDNQWTFVAGQLLQGGWVLAIVCPVLIAYLFPDGHALSRGWATWIVAFVAGYVVFMLAAAGDRSGFVEVFPSHEPPLPTLSQPVAGVVGLVALAFVPASLVGAVISARRRYNRSTGQERLQLQWFALSALSLPAMMGLLWTTYFLDINSDAVVYPILAVGLSAIPVGIGIGILRWGLFDVELVLSRALTYGALSLGVIVLYAALLLLTERLLTNRSAAGLFAAAVVAVAVQPAHAWLRRRIERAVYGYRSQPHEALRMLADRAELADPLGLTESITATVAEALKVEQAWVEEDSEPEPGERVLRAPLVHRGVRLGDLAVGVPPGRQFSAADTELFHDLAKYAAVLVGAERLNAQLVRSRAGLVTAREEERRRLRRDLHDGLGPSLAAIVLKLNAAETRPTEGERRALLAETRDEARAAIAEVRRLVDDMRPPAIDEVGLLNAIRQRVGSLSADLTVEVDGPPEMPPLPAAVEVAAFRIASEAVTNAARHAGASRCRVTLELDDALAVTVTDNGRGAPVETRTGVGWTSMRERAAELGGSCTISTPLHGGLVVRAVLPLVDIPHDTDIEAEVTP